MQHVPPVGRGIPASPLEVRYRGNKTVELQIGKMYRFHDTEKSGNREKGVAATTLKVRLDSTPPLHGRWRLRGSTKALICALLVTIGGGLRSRAEVAYRLPDASEPILVLDSGGHTARVMTVLFTPDGKRLISVSHDKTIRTWDVATGSPLRVLRPPIGPGPQGMLYAEALSPDARTLATAGNSGKIGESRIVLIDLATNRIARVLTGHASSVTAMAFSPDGTRLASASLDRTARIWNPADGQCERVLEGHEDQIYGLAFSPDGRRLATASLDKTGRIWSIANGQCETVLRGHQREVQCVAWRPDGQVVATGGWDGAIRQWTPDGLPYRGFTSMGQEITSLKFTADSHGLLYTQNAWGLPSSTSQPGPSRRNW